MPSSDISGLSTGALCPQVSVMVPCPVPRLIHIQIIPPCQVQHRQVIEECLKVGDNTLWHCGRGGMSPYTQEPPQPFMENSSDSVSWPTSGFPHGADYVPQQPPTLPQCPFPTSSETTRLLITSQDLTLTNHRTYGLRHLPTPKSILHPALQTIFHITSKEGFQAL